MVGGSGGATPSAAAFAAVAARQRAAAEAAVRDAETAAAAQRDAKKKKQGATAAVVARAALHRACVAAAAVEEFPWVWAAPLHALVARPLDAATAAEALPGLSAAAAAKLMSYLAAWLTVYSAGGAVDLSVRPTRSLPSLASVVSWASAVIDAHFTTFAMARAGSGGGVGGDGGDATAALRESALKLQTACASVGRVSGALQHMRECAPLPENHGVLSTTYTIELVDW